MKIGLLALQGDFAEHIAVLRRIGVEACEVRLPQQLDDLNGLIIPGGESTTIGKLAVHYGLMDLRNSASTSNLGHLCRGDLSFKGCPRQHLIRLDGN
jgi:5'-phosphate synthase pdxT subunit